MKDNTILRIKVPARLYEAVKAQLTLKEEKINEASLEIDWGADEEDLAQMAEKHGLQYKYNPQGPSGGGVAILMGPKNQIIAFLTDEESGDPYAQDAEDLEFFTQTITEGKQNFGTKDMKPVKGQKAASGDSSDKPKKTSAPKAKAPKKAEAPAAEKKEVPKDGHKKAEKKPRSIEELKAAYEAIGNMIAEMEKGKDKVEESKWGREEYMDEPDYDEERGAFVKYAPKKKWRPKYVPKGQSTMTTGDIGHSSLSKFDLSKEK